jgi:hypothetical protein
MNAKKTNTPKEGGRIKGTKQQRISNEQKGKQIIAYWGSWVCGCVCWTRRRVRSGTRESREHFPGQMCWMWKCYFQCFPFSTSSSFAFSLPVLSRPFEDCNHLSFVDVLQWYVVGVTQWLLKGLDFLFFFSLRDPWQGSPRRFVFVFVFHKKIGQNAVINNKRKKSIYKYK